MNRGVVLATICTIACALAPATLGGSAVRRPPVTWSPAGSGSNFTPTLHRRIDRIVIHVTDGGSLVGNLSWLAGERSEASAHYVVSRDGAIVQLVPLHDVAWHSGNRAVNLHSIGIEHVGETYGPDGFTRAEYVASARLVAWLVRRYDIPADRRHVVGHAEVPDPSHPGLVGGSSHHTDPGPHWKWGFYMRLVRRFAFPPVLTVTTTLPATQPLTGVVPWGAATAGIRATRVDFVVDGRVLWSDARPPFSFAGGRGLNTTALANGRHVLAVRAHGRRDEAARSIVVDVANHVFALTTAHVRPWQKVRGTLRVRARAWGAHATGVALYVDGRAVSRDRSAPYTLRWDSRRARDGRHRISLVATSVDGRLARRRLPVVVSNRPAARRVPRPRIVSESVADGASVTGTLDWRVHTTGAVARVDFVVDGAQLASQTREPWRIAWDGSSSPGAHVLTVRASTFDGQVAVRTVTVTVTPPATASTPP